MTATDFGLDECIRNYDRENDRKKSLESKASYFLGIISILIALWANLFNYTIINHSISILLIILVSLIVLISFLIVSCGIYCIKIIRIQNYHFPISGNDPNQIKSLLTKPTTKLRGQLFESYVMAFSINNLVNNKKANFLNEASKLLFYSIIITIISILVLGWIIWF